jgi:hypothetical protein
MRNRFKRASYAVAAGVTVAATIGLSAAGAGATVKPAATNACSFHCIDVSFQNPGLGDILAAHSGLAEVNNVVRLVPGSNGNSKSDFSRISVGTIGGPVTGLYCGPNGVSLDPTIFTNKQCKLMFLAGLYPATTFQLAFNPNNGGDETLCVGSWDNEPPVSGFKLRLEDCGVAADTVLIRSPKIPGGNTGIGDWLINGASDNFSTPLVATSTGSTNSQPTWSTVRLNGQHAIDTQETRFFPGPF